MLFGKKKGLAIETLLGARTKLEGDLRFSGGLRIDGEIKGNIYGDPDKPSMLVITDSARIEGEVHVGHLILNGTVVGPVHVAELLELQPKARIEGNVQYAAHFLRELRTRERNWTMAVARYNAGPNNEPAQKKYVCADWNHKVKSLPDDERQFQI